MKSILKLNLIGISILLSLPTVTAVAQTKLVKNLMAGKHQVLVVYGTSLTAATGGRAWVDSVNHALNNKYNGLLTTINAAKSAMWSTWGVQNLEDSVIKRNPDAVLIEFSMNDAFLAYKTSPDVARLNLNYMIDRIKLNNPDCAVILQVMDIPINGNATARPNILAYNQVYRDVAKKRGLLLIDHYPHWLNILNKGKDVYLKYVPDGIHPDAKSAREIIAPYILKELQE